MQLLLALGLVDLVYFFFLLVKKLLLLLLYLLKGFRQLLRKTPYVNDSVCWCSDHVLQVCAQTQPCSYFSTGCAANNPTCCSFIYCHYFISARWNHDTCIVINKDLNLVKGSTLPCGFRFLFPYFLAIWKLPQLQELIMAGHNVPCRVGDVHRKRLILALFFLLHHKKVLCLLFLKLFHVVLLHCRHVNISKNDLFISTTW